MHNDNHLVRREFRYFVENICKNAALIELNLTKIMAPQKPKEKDSVSETNSAAVDSITTPNISGAKGFPQLPPDRSPMQWVAWMLNRTAIFVRWVLGTALPLYLVIGSICFIAIPKEFLPPPFSGHKQQFSGSPSAPAVIPPTATVGAISSQMQTEQARITEIAKMTIDATKERIDTMKENYDKLFSLIAALGALLAFFGFKGVETFISARSKAEETVEKAEAAIAKAKAAQLVADKAVESLNNFLHTKYQKDNAAELNVSQSIILRELAEMYKALNSKESPMNLKDPIYCDYLRSAQYYIDKVTDNPEGIDSRILARAFVVRGNILSRLGDCTGALKMAELVFEKHSPNDHSALFNGACYACRLAKVCSDNGDHRGATTYETKSLSYLKKAIDLNEDYKAQAATDVDFDHLRERSQFKCLVE